VSTLLPLLGVAAGLIAVLDTVPYLRDVVRGTTRPHPGTWLIWSALAVIVCLSQWADGASWSLIMTLTQAVVTTAVFALTVVRGKGGMTRADVMLMANPPDRLGTIELDRKPSRPASTTTIGW
jgi:hypothetical protein